MMGSIRHPCNVLTVTDLPPNDSKQPSLDVRAVIANILMATFILSTSVGVTLLWSIGAGLLALGLTAAIVGYLLGAE